jgi:hypothetical protein
MIGKITLSVAVGLALFAATVRLPASTCILSNISTQKACQPGCCANKSCCETSDERTGPPVQPLAKTSIDQQNIAPPPSTMVVAMLSQPATQLAIFPGADGVVHSPPPLALICIRLI